ncbi:MAG TPA: hypothetical protein VFX43_02745 [Chitinophagaceae bacterium]|nr:hypothetical protein [Chitinophagaceae bacterium]
MLLCQYAAGKLSFPTGRLEGSDGAVEMVDMNTIYFSPSAMIIHEWSGVGNTFSDAVAVGIP